MTPTLPIALPPALEAAIQIGFWLGLVFTSCFAIFRLVYQRVTGHGLPRTKLVLAIEALVELLPSLAGSLNKGAQAVGQTPLFLPPPGTVTHMSATVEQQSPADVLPPVDQIAGELLVLPGMTAPTPAGAPDVENPDTLKEPQ